MLPLIRPQSDGCKGEALIMDPNEALALIRKLTTLVRSGPEGPEEWADDLADAVSGLDERLSRGGFLPQDWRTAHE